MTDPILSPIVQCELGSNDVSRTRVFLEKVFGWEFKKDQVGGGEYWTFDAGADPVLGLTAPKAGMGPGTTAYIVVESIDETIEKITAHGGRMLGPKQQIPGICWFAYFEGPGEIKFAVYQGARRP